MRVVGFAGPSNVGKTTLITGVLAALKAAGLRVSVLKHAHKRFDLDVPGKDSWRHREAGAFEVLLASQRRLALLREYEAEGEPSVHALLAELSPCDWVLVEGFKHADLPKVEVRRTAAPEQGPPLYAEDPRVVALATDTEPPIPTSLPVLSIDDPGAVAQWLMQSASRFDYLPEDHG
ncbi:molybdopterin-guanine dinucleotide biosynthesis protein B [Aquincola sp. MAHUQ-54]|uniref:Molybdopterin-guanine dinucleotide biosynthesis protein B n=1 Tax=Aquincola agrisoli TaxID=3119538 RepID=A0AAW9QKQ9_9BURK